MNNNEFKIANLSDNDHARISERLCILRNDILHISQQKCSDILGISQTYLSLLETGERKISKKILETYHKQFKVNKNWILYGDEANGIIQGEKTPDIDPIAKKQQKSLDIIRKSFHLSQADIDFISRLLSMDTAKRRQFIRSMQTIKDLLD